MKKSLLTIVIVFILIGGAFYGQANWHLFSKPCSTPISYSLGTFDTQFNLSQADFLADINQAVMIWDEPTGKTLFKYDPNSNFKINLIYDTRQQATDKLKSLGYSINNTQSSYDSLKQRYNSMTADYNTLKSNLDREVADYDTKRASYEAQVNYWNSRGGAPKSTANQLNAQAASLNTEANKIKADQDTLNSLVNDINAAVDALNSMAKNLNLSVKNYNTVGQARGSEFEEGAYIESGNTKSIDIYEYQNKSGLIRVLAHELGHALGLQHLNSDPQAIMYYLNQGTVIKATATDISAIDQLCGIKN